MLRYPRGRCVPIRSRYRKFKWSCERKRFFTVLLPFTTVSKKVVFPRASSYQQWCWLEPVHIGLAAEVGASHVTVNAPSRVSIITTGNELVSDGQIPGKGQIRNTNEPMLAAAVARCGAEPIPMGIAKDHAESLRALMAQGLAADILLISGGVSAGDYDLVPRTLEKMGVQCIFHKVCMKPGKPIWFGVFQRPEAYQHLSLVSR